MILFERSIPIPAARSRTAHPFDILQHAAGEHEALRQSNNSRRRRRSHNSSIIIPRSEGQFRPAPAFGGHRVSDTSLAEWHFLTQSRFRIGSIQPVFEMYMKIGERKRCMSERPFSRALPYEPRAAGGCETPPEEECLVHTCSRNADKEASLARQAGPPLSPQRSPEIDKNSLLGWSEWAWAALCGWLQI